jgi:hypothetical protein
VVSGSALCGQWFCTVWSVVLHCLVSGSTLCGQRFYTVWSVVLHCVVSGSALCGHWFYIVWSMVLHCLVSDSSAVVSDTSLWATTGTFFLRWWTTAGSLLPRVGQSRVLVLNLNSGECEDHI